MQEDCTMLPSSPKTTYCMMKCDCRGAPVTRATVHLGYCAKSRIFAEQIDVQYSSPSFKLYRSSVDQNLQ